MTHSTPSLPPLPLAIEPSPWRVFGGVWRLTYPDFFSARRLFVLVGLSTLLSLYAVQNFGHGQTTEFYRWTTWLYLTLVLPGVAFLAAASAIRDDMQSVSVDYMLTRPVRRPVFVASRYVSRMLCMQVSCLLPLAAVCAAGYFEGVERLASMLPQLLLAQALVVAGFSALGFLFGAFTTHYFVLGVIYGLIVEIGVGQIPTQIGRLSMTHHVLAMLSPIIPDARGMHEPESVFLACGAICVFVLTAVGGAIAVFSMREFTGSGTAEK